MTIASLDRLETRALTCVRGERVVFSDLEMSVGAGEAVLLQGPNGSGKTSMSRLLAGLGPPAAGAILWNGTSIGDDAVAHRRRLLFLSHQDGVKPWLTVAENLEFGLALSGAPRAALGDALALLGLDRVSTLAARALSAGQKRRLALTRFAAIKAPLWLLDEPTAGLDQASIATVEAMIARHCAAGGIAVVATHLALAIAAALRLELAAPRALAV